jgi:hypothetical protein
LRHLPVAEHKDIHHVESQHLAASRSAVIGRQLHLERVEPQR